MKAFFFTLLALSCAAVLVLGNLHWQNKTAVSGKETNSPVKTETGLAPTDDELLAYAANWPQKAQKQLKKALEKNKPFTILLAGSDTEATDKNGWAELVKENMHQAYGKAVNVETLEFDMNSVEFVNGDHQKEVAKEKADLIILEPFILKDNGVVPTNDSIANLERILTDVRYENPKTAFVIQPSFPLYDAKYYPLNVKILKNFTEDNGLIYLDHWTAWPDTQSKELEDYLSDKGTAPNKKGHEVWGKYVSEFLISE